MSTLKFVYFLPLLVLSLTLLTTAATIRDSYPRAFPAYEGDSSADTLCEDISRILKIPSADDLYPDPSSSENTYDYGDNGNEFRYKGDVQNADNDEVKRHGQHFYGLMGRSFPPSQKRFSSHKYFSGLMGRRSGDVGLQADGATAKKILLLLEKYCQDRFH